MSIAGYVLELFYRARDARRAIIPQWKKNYKVLNMRSYGASMDSWFTPPSISEVWPVIASSVAWMTDQRPTIEVVPSAEPFSPYADWYAKLAQDMNVCISAAFTEQSLDNEIGMALWDVNTYGIGYFKTTWEPWLADGLGDTAFRRVDPFTIYVDPFARNSRDITYIIEAKVMTVNDLDRAYPGAAKQLGYNGGNLEDADEAPHRLDANVGNGAPRVQLAPLSPATASRYASTGTRPDAFNLANPVTVLEAWVRTHESEKVDEHTHKVYDRWRCIVVCGTHVLMDEPAANVNAYGTHPYERLVLFDTGEWYGPCMVEFLTSPQESINRMLTAIEQNITLMGNPVLVESPFAKSRNKRMTNRPGARLEANNGEVAWLNPPQVHPQMSTQLIQFYESRIETISGLSAMVRGFSPSGRNSAGVLDTVQDAAFVRVRASLRQLERALKGVGSKMAANVAEFYTEPRLQSLIGPDGQRTFLALRARHFYVVDPDEQGERVPMRFNLIADAGSQLPTSKQARSADAERLYALGAIDVYELLKAKGWPNWAITAKRIMEQQAAAGQIGQGPGQRQATRA